MQPPSPDAAKALAFANGLRKNVAAAGRRWMAWPGGANHLARVTGAIDRVHARLREPLPADQAPAIVAAAIGDLRAILEWTTYQSGSLATARALLVARRTRAFVERFGLLDANAPPVASLEAADDALIASVATRNGYLAEIAARHPHLGLPRPLVSAESLAPRPAKPPGRLALMQRLMKSAKDVPPPRP